MTDKYAKLREAAEKATPGPWYPGHLGSDSTCQCRSIVDDGGYMGAIATVHVDNGLPVGEGGNDAPPAEEAAANMQYIALANPQTVLALLDHLAAEEARADAAEARINEWSTDTGELKRKNDDAEATIASRRYPTSVTTLPSCNYARCNYTAQDVTTPVDFDPRNRI